MMPILEYEVLSNTVTEWIVAVAVAAAVFTGLVLGRALLRRQLERLAARTATALDDLAGELVGKTRIGFLGTVALYLATLPLELPEQADTVLARLIVLAVVLQGALWGNHALKFALEHQKGKRGADAPSGGSLQLVGFLGRVLLWSIVGLITLDNLGIDVT